MISPSGEVLIVDADAPIRGLLATLVRRVPRKPVMAGDGNRALQLLTSRDFDAVIMELMLSGVSGIELLEYLGKTKPDLLSRVIVVTTETRIVRENEELATVAAVLRKPFAIDELQRVLHFCCDGPKTGGQ